MARAKRDRQNAELETVDLEGVEIMDAVGPVKGIGSPPAGDHWKPEEIAGMASAGEELQAAGEVPPPAAIGHFPKFSDPAVGLLRNFRTEGNKLVVDLKQVPKKTADLIRAGAFPYRSVDLVKNYTSQATGKTYPWAVTGLAFGGGRMPAVKTLADVPHLYENAGEAERHFVQFTEIEVDEEPTAEAFTELARAYTDMADRVGTLLGELADSESRRRSDTRPVSDQSKYTDDQRRAFSEATGLEADKVTDDMLAKAGVVAETPEPDPAPAPKPDGDDGARALEEKFAALDAKVAAAEKRAFEAECKTVLDEAVKEGKITPGEREGWALRYEAAPDKVVEALQKLPKNEQAAREYGSDAEGETDDDKRQLEERYAATFKSMFPDLATEAAA